jgi:hypothetical protein
LEEGHRLRFSAWPGWNEHSELPVIKWSATKCSWAERKAVQELNLLQRNILVRKRCSFSLKKKKKEKKKRHLSV